MEYLPLRHYLEDRPHWLVASSRIGTAAEHALGQGKGRYTVHSAKDSQHLGIAFASVRLEDKESPGWSVPGGQFMICGLLS